MNNENNTNLEIEIGEKYLPIGTVVMLKGGKKRVMITGFCTVAQEDQSRLFDYSGCIYPEGFIESNQVCLFDHEQIDKVYHKGLIDEEETQFKENLKAIIDKVGEENILKGITNNESVVPEEPKQQTEPIPSIPPMPEIPIASQAPVMPETQNNDTSNTQF